MIRTLVVTILIEGIVCLLYALWRKNPVAPVLLTSVLANLVTQSLLWVTLRLFFRYYLMTLLTAEFFIWLIEGVIFFSWRWNRLDLKEALSLSLLMNVSSLGVGWFLPV